MPDFSDQMLSQLIDRAMKDPSSELGQSLRRPAQPSIFSDDSSGPTPQGNGPQRAAAAGELADLLTTFQNMSRGASDTNKSLITGHPVLSGAILGAEDLGVHYLLHKLAGTGSAGRLVGQELGYGEGISGLVNAIRNARMTPQFEQK